jgi:hypothetical protein
VVLKNSPKRCHSLLYEEEKASSKSQNEDGSFECAQNVSKSDNTCFLNRLYLCVGVGTCSVVLSFIGPCTKLRIMFLYCYHTTKNRLQHPFADLEI